MSRYVIINGKKAPKTIEVSDASIHKTDYGGHALDIIREVCAKDPAAEIHIYGGDGSVFEAVNAVMSVDNPKEVSLVIHPLGTGNDFVRNFPDKSQAQNLTIDLIKFDNRYAANEINIGFDCDVVVATQKVKKIPFLKGSLAYLIGIFMTLLKKMGRDFDITYTDVNGTTTTIQDNLLLCLFSNGGYYGGGFNCAPLASLNDGYLEMITVSKISRLKFLTFFLGYRKGKHLNPDGTVPKKYQKILHYSRVKSAEIRNVGNICADGEIFNYDTLSLSVQENAFKISIANKAK